MKGMRGGGRDQQVAKVAAPLCFSWNRLTVLWAGFNSIHSTWMARRGDQ